MAEVVWTEPALSDLDAIADYIALENPSAAAELVKRVFRHVEQLIDHPDSGSRPQELRRSRYRQIVEPPCRVFYRHAGNKVFVLHVMRSERLLRKERLATRTSRMLRKGKIALSQLARSRQSRATCSADQSLARSIRERSIPGSR